MLFFSSQEHSGTRIRYEPRFNLVIEMLFFSRKDESVRMDTTVLLFQSRNRDAFLFKVKWHALRIDLALVVSIS